MFVSIDPTTPENQQAVNLAFAIQAAPDIQSKYQKIEWFEGETFKWVGKDSGKGS